jgi:hypothetical protein
MFVVNQSLRLSLSLLLVAAAGCTVKDPNRTYYTKPATYAGQVSNDTWQVICGPDYRVRVDDKHFNEFYGPDGQERSQQEFCDASAKSLRARR